VWGDWGPNAVGPGENGGFGYGWGNQGWGGGAGQGWGNGYGYGNNHVGYDGGATIDIRMPDGTIVIVDLDAGGIVTDVSPGREGQVSVDLTLSTAPSEGYSATEGEVIIAQAPENMSRYNSQRYQKGEQSQVNEEADLRKLGLGAKHVPKATSSTTSTTRVKDGQVSGTPVVVPKPAVGFDIRFNILAGVGFTIVGYAVVAYGLKAGGKAGLGAGLLVGAIGGLGAGMAYPNDTNTVTISVQVSPKINVSVHR
jgi:hypothetical protein